MAAPVGAPCPNCLVGQLMSGVCEFGCSGEQFDEPGDPCSVYVVQLETAGPIKVGIACNVRRRMGELQTSNPYQLALRGTFQCPSEDAAVRLESQVHALLAEYRVRGEWFRPCEAVRDAIAGRLGVEVRFYSPGSARLTEDEQFDSMSTQMKRSYGRGYTAGVAKAYSERNCAECNGRMRAAFEALSRTLTGKPEAIA